MYLTQISHTNELASLLNKLADLQLEYAEICERQVLKIMEDIIADQSKA